MAHTKIKSLAIFCGSNIGADIIYQRSAVEISEILIEADITVIYGGASVGLMGIVANEVLKLGGKVIGVIPQSMVDVEIAHKNLTSLYVVNSMHERKAMIAELADGFMMLPGGTGSLDEFFEIFTWQQLGYHSKPCGILNINHYYDHLIKFLNHSVQEGFLKAIQRNTILIDDSPKQLFEKLINAKVKLTLKWIQGCDNVKPI